MKNITLLLFVFAAFLFGNVSYAQADLGSTATTLTKSVDDQVQLSQTQYDQIYTINMAYLTAESKLDRSNLADGRYYRERKALNDTRLRDLNNVLNSTQRGLLIGARRS